MIYSIFIEYKMTQVNLEGAELMKYHIVERGAFQVVGVKRECLCTAEEGGIPDISKFWSEAHENGTVAQLSQLNNGQIKGLLGITENFNKETNKMDYWIAAEYSGEVSTELWSFELPASKWIVFEVRGPIPTAMINTWKQIDSKWFASNVYEPANIPPIEAYIDSDLYCANSYNEIWLAIK